MAGITDVNAGDIHVSQNQSILIDQQVIDGSTNKTAEDVSGGDVSKKGATNNNNSVAIYANCSHCYEFGKLTFNC